MLASSAESIGGCAGTDRSSLLGGWNAVIEARGRPGYGSKMRTLIAMDIIREWASPGMLIFKTVILPILLMCTLYFMTIINRRYTAVDTVVQPQPKLSTCRHTVERDCVDVTVVSGLEGLDGLANYIVETEQMPDAVVEHFVSIEDLRTSVEETPHVLRKNMFGVELVNGELTVTLFTSGTNDLYNSWDYFAPSCKEAIEAGEFCMWERNYPVLYEHVLTYVASRQLGLDLDIQVDVSGYPADKKWFTTSFMVGMPYLLCAFIIGVPCIAVASTIIGVSEDKEEGRTLFLEIQGITEFMQFGIEYIITTFIVQLGIFIMVVMAVAMDMDIIYEIDVFPFWFVNMLTGIYIVSAAMCFRPLMKKRLMDSS